MKTDKQLYALFAANPLWIFELTKIDSPGPAVMKSVALKAIERTADGVVFPESPEPPLSVVEFQFQFDAAIYTRIVLEMALLQQQYVGRGIQGIILFADRSLDPRAEPWVKVVQTFYLGELLTDLELRSPEHPLVAVFRPIMEENEAALEKEIGRYYNQITSSDLPESIRIALIDVFLNWVGQRFRYKDKQEIEEMIIGALPDIRETQLGKDLIQIGWSEGKLEGKLEGNVEGQLEAKIDSLLLVLQARFGVVDAQIVNRVKKIEIIKHLDELLVQVLAVGSPSDLKW